VQNEFGRVDLGDMRRARRLRTTVAHLAKDPGWSIPHASGAWSATKGAYRFFANEHVSREAIMDAHIKATVDRVRAQGDVLVPADTTYLNLTHHPGTTGVGKIGNRNKQELKGVLVHSALAVTPGTHRVLGVLDQQVLIRDGHQPVGEDSKKKRNRKRESQKWLATIASVASTLPDPTKAIVVFDREGDMFEAIEEAREARVRFVIRGSVNRRIEVEADADQRYLFDAVAAEPVRARKDVVIAAGGGRKERTAHVVLRGACFTLLPPTARGRKGAPQTVNVVLAREEAPPADTAPVEWILLTSEPIETADELLRVLDHYCGRWKIEEWHKALKTGCRIEDRQLSTWERMDALLGVMSVLAWRLVALRDAARDESGVEQSAALTDMQRQIIEHVDPSLRGTNDARRYLRCIAGLGGFLGRKSDGDPGWITIWRGFSRLGDMEAGFRLAWPSGRSG